MSSFLKNKYGEALYKDQMYHSREINFIIEHLTNENNKFSKMIDTASQTFINESREKREKWLAHDQKYRKYYKLICLNTQDKKFANLSKCLSPSKLHVLEPELQYKMLLLRRELDVNEQEHEYNKTHPQVLRLDSKESSVPKLPQIKGVAPAVYKLPNAADIEEDFLSLHSRYSESDLEFLKNTASKHEILNTDIGKRFIANERQKIANMVSQQNHFNHIQKNALVDKRFNGLFKSLDVKHDFTL